MMKKFLVLTLVLGMASLANATLIFAVDDVLVTADVTLLPGEVVELSIYSDTEIPGFGAAILSYVHVTDGDGVVADPVLTPLTSPTMVSFVEAYTDTESALVLGDGFKAMAAVLFTPLAAGEWFTFSFTMGDVPSTVTLFDDSGDGGWAGDVRTCVNFVPEPMTMVLLGLGGLFLRRRK